MLRYKIDVLAAIKAAGYNTTQIHKSATAGVHTLLGTSALQKLRQRKMVGTKALDQICTMLHCQPGDLVEWCPNEKEGV